MIKISDELRARIRDHEGCRDTIYSDTLGKRTVGIGHLLRPHEVDDIYKRQPLSMDEIEELFDIDLNRAAAGADALVEEFCPDTKLPKVVEEVIVEMVFQLGQKGVSRFKKMWAALADKDFVTAAAEMKDSRWHEQTPVRCQELASLVENA